MIDREKRILVMLLHAILEVFSGVARRADQVGDGKGRLLVFGDHAEGVVALVSAAVPPALLHAAVPFHPTRILVFVDLGNESRAALRVREARLDGHYPQPNLEYDVQARDLRAPPDLCACPERNVALIPIDRARPRPVGHHDLQRAARVLLRRGGP
eukprot:CAMPEP_0180128210 /NCGR_PEP_ID=MMETSP0986-20121125/6634_1 /TAXON_ID=697907 /ORGANISM="non described non described, Strain CCMP2293" /LENGTH=155 /DNA_ID=CAMNT_0022067743 /DNA_START=186 /DNA_END=650 /DNA_ORIENTATION=+